MRRKISLTGVILDILQTEALASAHLFEMMTKTYHASYRMARTGYSSFGQPEKLWSEIYENKKSFRTILSRLSKDGLIEKKKIGNKIIWALTAPGKTKLKKQSDDTLLLEIASQKSTNPIIISYDIPENLQHSRAWLRGVLRLFDFVPVHKSVWIGNKKIPEEFLKILSEREILEYTQIFEVTKQGTLTRVTK